MATKIILKSNKAFTRSYDSTGKVTANCRGTAIKVMLDSVKGDEKYLKSYKRYKRIVGANAVGYVYYTVMVRNFLPIYGMELCKALLDELDKNPRVTMQSAVQYAQGLANMIDSGISLKKVA